MTPEILMVCRRIKGQRRNGKGELRDLLRITFFSREDRRPHGLKTGIDQAGEERIALYASQRIGDL